MTLWLSAVSLLLIMALPIAAASLLRGRRRGTPWYLFLVGSVAVIERQEIWQPLLTRKRPCVYSRRGAVFMVIETAGGWR